MLSALFHPAISQTRRKLPLPFPSLPSLSLPFPSLPFPSLPPTPLPLPPHTSYSPPPPRSATQLRLGEKLSLRNQNVAIYSWEGATVTLTSDPSDGTLAYISDETPVPSYLALHDTLSARRAQALAHKTTGPHVLVVGPTDAGKSTLCRLLASWAARTGWHPALVDLDLGQGDFP